MCCCYFKSFNHALAQNCEKEVVSSLKALATETLLKLLRTSLEQKNLWPADVFYILDQENQGYLLPVTWMMSYFEVEICEVFGGNQCYVLLLRSFLSKFSQNPEGLFVRTLDTKADLERGVPWMLSNKDISIKEAKNTCVLCPAIYDTKVLLHLTFLPLRIPISKLCRCREVKGEVPMLLLFRGPNSSEQRCLGSLFLEPL